MIRSFHKVGRDFTDTRIHTFGRLPNGQPLRLPVPIPLMGLVWAFVTFVGLLIVGRVLGVANLPSHPRGAGAYGPVVLFHVGVPIAVAWVMSMAEVEGRRIHVVLRAWVAQGFAKRYRGGWEPTSRPGDRTRYRRIEIRYGGTHDA